ncbi:hypothetical protein B0H13DRAFT_2277917 [Mycena leptocephala]|nr:hypothetical protein B0H13DRAFT_2277917 [Mycena leptocephala]
MGKRQETGTVRGPGRGRQRDDDCPSRRVARAALEGNLRTGLGHREWTMQTLGVVRAYVGFPPSPSLASAHPDAAPGSEGVYSQIPNLVRCEPVRSGGTWSRDRDVIQAPAWARDSDRVMILTSVHRLKQRGREASVARNATREKHREPYSLSVLALLGGLSKASYYFRLLSTASVPARVSLRVQHLLSPFSYTIPTLTSKPKVSRFELRPNAHRFDFYECARQPTDPSLVEFGYLLGRANLLQIQAAKNHIQEAEEQHPRLMVTDGKAREENMNYDGSSGGRRY